MQAIFNPKKTAELDNTVTYIRIGSTKLKYNIALHQPNAQVHESSVGTFGHELDNSRQDLDAT